MKAKQNLMKMYSSIFFTSLIIPAANKIHYYLYDGFEEVIFYLNVIAATFVICGLVGLFFGGPGNLDTTGDGNYNAFSLYIFLRHWFNAIF